MRTTPRKAIALAGAAAALLVGLAGCGTTGSTGSAGTPNNKVGVLLPDTASSPR
jgi:D-xylose transport system substrate-binding protein